MNFKIVTMALFDEEYDVRMAEGSVREAEANLAAQKFNREQAKANGNYKNSSKITTLKCGDFGFNCINGLRLFLFFYNLVIKHLH